jgi:signal peptidase I
MSSAPAATLPHLESCAPSPRADAHLELDRLDVPGVVRQRRSLSAMRRAAPAIGWVVLSAVIALLFLPTALGYSRYAIVGGSMSPTFERGSAIYSKPVAVEALQVGDIITYVPPPRTGIDTLVTHRIIEITQTDDGSPLFRTQGDANDAVDPWTFTLDADRQNVVYFSVPHLGTVLTHLAQPDVRQVVIGIPAGLIAVGAVLDLLGVTSIRQFLLRRPRRAGTDMRADRH